MSLPEGTVEVVYALAEEQHVVPVHFVTGMSASDAVERSGLLQRFPQIGHGELVLGIYGTRVTAGHRIKPGDRVEICRPLSIDPRDMRRELMADGKVMGGKPR